MVVPRQSRVRGFPPYEGKHPLHQKSNVVRDLFRREPSSLVGQERPRAETMLEVDDESRAAGNYGGQAAQKDCD